MNGSSSSSSSSSSRGGGGGGGSCLTDKSTLQDCSMSVYSAFVLNNNCALLGLLMFVSIYNCQLLQELYSQN